MNEPQLAAQNTHRWWHPVALYVGPVLLFVCATAYGILEVHSSTDTWIGLAAGRQILESDHFPRTDTFSYTFEGENWYNQNWLTHVFQYWLYSHLGPNAVVYGTWALSSSVFLLTLLACYWRSGNLLGSLVAASVVALGGRDFLSARPATTGFFCIAALWALICAIEGQRHKTRWWPVALLLPLLLLWGNAHGSFVFGYGVLGLYVGHWFVARTIGQRRAWIWSLLGVGVVLLILGLVYARPAEGVAHRPEDLTNFFGLQLVKRKLAMVVGGLLAYGVYWLIVRLSRPRLAVRDGQIYGIVAAVLLAFVLTVWLGPFGLENFTHANKIASSDVFRQVSEWNPPTAPGRHFPPVWRFWTILYTSAGLIVLAAAVRVLPGTRGEAPRDRSADAEPPLHTSLFDAAVVVIGLAMTFWARRFAPIYFVFGAPVFLVWFLRLTRTIPAQWQRMARLGVSIGCLGFTAVVAHETITKARKELIEAFRPRPNFGLLERVTRYDATPHTAIEFIKRNALPVRVLTEWTQAGPVMFHAPTAQVYMDGRAQQVYDEDHYLKYQALLGNPRTPKQRLLQLLDEYDTNAVLLRRWGPAQNLGVVLEQSRDWIPALFGARYGLFLRRGSEPFNRLCELMRSGQAWWPDDPAALATQGLLWQAMNPPQLDKAVQCWRQAIRRNVRTGRIAFRPLTQALIMLGRQAEARSLIQGYYQVLKRPVRGMSDRERKGLLNILSNCWRDIQEAVDNKPGGP